MTYGTINADQIGTSVANTSLGAGNASIMKNRIINGAMVIDQRNAGASVTPTSDSYNLDRWSAGMTQASKMTFQQSSTAPSGFKNSLSVTVASAPTIGSGDWFGFFQKIEGFNTADLGFGATGALTVTISFWVRSSITGTYGGSLMNSAQNRSYPYTYTVNVANTWEQKTITIVGDTTGTWVGATNGTGMLLVWSLGAGSNFLGTANTWGTTNALGTTGQQNWVTNAAATFYITGVQLEVGSSATGFEYVNYQTSLANCQRYYQLCNGFLGTPGATTTNMYTAIQYQTAMRSTPTLGQTGIITMSAPGVDVWQQSSTGISNGGQNTTGTWIQLSNFSGLTNHRPYVQSVNYSNNGYVITLSAEL